MLEFVRYTNFVIIIIIIIISDHSLVAVFAAYKFHLGFTASH